MFKAPAIPRPYMGRGMAGALAALLPSFRGWANGGLFVRGEVFARKALEGRVIGLALRHNALQGREGARVDSRTVKTGLRWSNGRCP